MSAIGSINFPLQRQQVATNSELPGEIREMLKTYIERSMQIVDCIDVQSFRGNTEAQQVLDQLKDLFALPTRFLERDLKAFAHLFRLENICLVTQFEESARLLSRTLQRMRIGEEQVSQFFQGVIKIQVDALGQTLEQKVDEKIKERIAEDGGMYILINAQRRQASAIERQILEGRSTFLLEQPADILVPSIDEGERIKLYNEYFSLVAGGIQRLRQAEISEEKVSYEDLAILERALNIGESHESLSENLQKTIEKIPGFLPADSPLPTLSGYKPMNWSELRPDVMHEIWRALEHINDLKKYLLHQIEKECAKEETEGEFLHQQFESLFQQHTQIGEETQRLNHQLAALDRESVEIQSKITEGIANFSHDLERRLQALEKQGEDLNEFIARHICAYKDHCRD